MHIRLRRASPSWPGFNDAITRHISRIVSAEKRRAKESGVVGLILDEHTLVVGFANKFSLEYLRDSENLVVLRDAALTLLGRSFRIALESLPNPLENHETIDVTNSTKAAEAGSKSQDYTNGNVTVSWFSVGGGVVQPADLIGQNIIVLDLETARSPDDCLSCGQSSHDNVRGSVDHAFEKIGWERKVDLGLAIGCCYDYLDGKVHWFDRATLEATVQLFVERQPLLVTYNGLAFDLPLIHGLLWREAEARSTHLTDLAWATVPDRTLISLCEDFERLCTGSYALLAAIWQADSTRKFERGLNRLGSVAAANGYGTKEMDGAMAPHLWALGRHAEVLNYCMGDVEKTRKLFEQICATGQILRGDGWPLALPRRVQLVPQAW